MPQPKKLKSPWHSDGRSVFFITILVLVCVAIVTVGGLLYYRQATGKRVVSWADRFPTLSGLRPPSTTGAHQVALDMNTPEMLVNTATLFETLKSPVGVRNPKDGRK